MIYGHSKECTNLAQTLWSRRSESDSKCFGSCSLIKALQHRLLLNVARSFSTAAWATSWETEQVTSLKKDADPPSHFQLDTVQGELLKSLSAEGSCQVLQANNPLAGSTPSLYWQGHERFHYMILEPISLLLIRTSRSRSLAFTCLYSLYSSAIGARSSFCTFLEEQTKTEAR